jgi:hypothetical protein
MSIDTILLDIAPEMASVDPAVRARLISYATFQVGFRCNNDVKNLAIAYLTAHNYTLSQRGGVGGNITSEKEGDLARSFGGAMQDGTGLGSTSYGMEFLRLKKMFILTPRTRQVNINNDC